MGGGGQLCVFACKRTRAHVVLGHRSVMQVIHTQSVTHLIMHTGFYSQLHIVHTHTLWLVQLVRARRGSTDRF